MEYFMLGGVELRIENPTAVMKYHRNVIKKPYLSRPGSHVFALPGDGKELSFTAIVTNEEELIMVREFWKNLDPIPLISLNENAGYQVLFVIDDFVQKDHDHDFFEFQITLLEYTEWVVETKNFVNWKVSTPAAKPKCPESTVTNNPIGATVKVKEVSAKSIGL